MTKQRRITDKVREISPQIEFVWLNQPGWPVPYCSENIQRLLGYRCEQFVSGEVDYSQIIHPDDIDTVMAELGTALDSNEVYLTHQDYRLLDSEGQYHWIEDRTYIDRDEQGVAVQMIGCLQIVDDRHRSEALVKENSERLALVLEGTRLGMWDWYPQTNDVVFDQRWAQMLGLRLEDLDMVLDDWSSRVHPDDMDSCMADITAHMEGKVDFYENLHRMKHSSGDWVYILDRGRIVERDAQGNPLRFTGTHTDVTALKKAEIAARDALSARDRFFSSMSHELRTPMHAVLGLVELLLKRPESQPIMSELEVIAQNSEHLLNVLKDILDVAKLESGEITLSPEPIDLNRELENTLALFRARANSAGLDLSLQTDNQEHWVNIDRMRLTQVMNNLLSNAIKYTERGGSVLLKLSDSKIKVIDTGVGIEDVSRAFQPFTQEGELLDGHTTGLGLNIVKQLCEKMDLILDFQSQVNVGSNVSIDVQKCIIDKPEQVEVQADLGASMPSFKAKLLVVDDNPTNVMVASAMLAATPLEVMSASDGKQACELTESWQPDIILMDIHMPIMDGLSATKVIRQTNRKVEIIGLSADAFENAKQDSLAAGMNDYLIKPFQQEQIYQVLHNAGRRLALV